MGNTLPANLVYILKSQKVIKMGNSIVGSDVKHINLDFNVQIPVESCIRLNHMFAEKGLGQRKVSLKTMTEKTVGFTLLKGDLPLKFTNSKAPSSELRDYAARDAYASLLVGNHLRGVRNQDMGERYTSTIQDEDYYSPIN